MRIFMIDLWSHCGARIGGFYGVCCAVNRICLGVYQLGFVGGCVVSVENCRFDELYWGMIRLMSAISTLCCIGGSQAQG